MQLNLCFLCLLAESTVAYFEVPWGASSDFNPFVKIIRGITNFSVPSARLTIRFNKKLQDDDSFLKGDDDIPVPNDDDDDIPFPNGDIPLIPDSNNVRKVMHPILML